MLKLYFGPGACSFVPHVGLELVQAATGQAFEAQMVKLHKGEQRMPEFLAINPLGLVPVLVVNGQPLTQIVAICEYLDRQFPQAGLFPMDAWARSQAMSTLAWMNNTVHATFTRIFKPQNFAVSEAAQSEVRETAVNLFLQQLARIEGLLQEGASLYLNGDQPGLTDAYAFTFYRWARLVKLDIGGLTRYADHVRRLIAHPAFSAVIAREGLKVDDLLVA